jgi:hypothetical protein
VSVPAPGRVLDRPTFLLESRKGDQEAARSLRHACRTDAACSGGEADSEFDPKPRRAGSRSELAISECIDPDTGGPAENNVRTSKTTSRSGGFLLAAQAAFAGMQCLAQGSRLPHQLVLDLLTDISAGAPVAPRRDRGGNARGLTVAITIGITRYDECASCVPEMQRPATIRPSASAA